MIELHDGGSLAGNESIDSVDLIRLIASKTICRHRVAAARGLQIAAVAKATKVSPAA